MGIVNEMEIIQRIHVCDIEIGTKPAKTFRSLIVEIPTKIDVKDEDYYKFLQRISGKGVKNG